MATPVNFMSKFLAIEFRAQHITNLLRARCYILSLKKQSLSPETLKRLHDTHLDLEKFENATKRIIELDNGSRLTTEEKSKLETLYDLWIDLKSKLCTAIYSLESESKLLQSLSASEDLNFLGILEDLNQATHVFRMQYGTSDT